MKTPQQLGREYEEDLARRIGGTPVPQSGAGFTKLDVFGSKILLSLKHTIHQSFRVGEELFAEIRTAIYGHGGVGPDYLGALVVKTANEEAVVMSFDDFMRMMNRLSQLEAENVAIRDAKKQEGLTEQEIVTAIGEGYAVPTGRTAINPKRMRSRRFR